MSKQEAGLNDGFKQKGPFWSEEASNFSLKDSFEKKRLFSGSEQVAYLNDTFEQKIMFSVSDQMACFE